MLRIIGKLPMAIVEHLAHCVSSQMISSETPPLTIDELLCLESGRMGLKVAHEDTRKEIKEMVYSSLGVKHGSIVET